MDLALLPQFQFSLRRIHQVYLSKFEKEQGILVSQYQNNDEQSEGPVNVTILSTEHEEKGSKAESHIVL